MLKKIALLGAATVALVSTGAHAATVPATAEVDILAPVTLVQTAGLDFGVVGGSVAGTVTIAAASGSTANCSAGLLCASTSRPGAFNVAGANSYNITISVAASTTLDDGAGPGAAMTLNLTPSTTSVTGAGSATPVAFYVGGVLGVNANQAAGTYTGNYNVSADYQ